MKKRILAFVCAAVMVVGMSLSVSAAGSSTASAKAEEVLVNTTDNSFGQSFGTDTLAFFAQDTKIDGATVSQIGTQDAKEMIDFARSKYGNGVFFSAMFDLSGKTGDVSFTSSNIWKGQNVVAIHEISQGNYEVLPVEVTADNKGVIKGVKSNSPFGIVVLTSPAPKTGEVIAMVLAMAAVSGFGAATCAKRAKNN